jgi:TonB family protein
MAYVELGQDNGAILLNLGEGGFAVQSALALRATEFPELRFQVPQLRGWLSARGRIVWMSEYKTVAGIQFLELPEASRLEIRKWASSEEEGEHPEAEQRGTMEPRTIVSETAYRGDPRDRGVAAPMETAANTTQAAPRSESVASGHHIAAHMPPAAVPVVQRASARADAAEAPPSQDFRFNEYSMFAAEPGREQVWVEAGRQKTGSGRVALMLIVVAALFFALGATVGRGTLDPWIAYVEAWVQGPAAPSVKPPAPVDELSSAAPDSQETGQQGGSGASGDQAGAAQQAPNATPDSNPPTQSGRVDGKASERATPEASSQANTIAKGAAAGASLPSKKAFSAAAPPPAPKQPAKTVVSRSANTAGESEDARVGGHSILVNAPEPGSPPFTVNLPSEAVSASSSVAISVQRSIQVPPRAGRGYARPERVVIGGLISHGEPFYPAEARNRRLEGGVEVHATVGRTGHVIGVRPVSGPSLLASAAMTAIREWQYEPTFIDGDPVETQAEITMVFRLP